MATLNKVMLIGRLTDNPTDGATNSGTRIAKFRFAVGRSRKNPQTGQWENDPNPLYIDCEAFSRPDAKRDLVSLIMQYCKKGDPLYLDGRLQLDQWDDKNGGGKRSKHKVVVDNIEFLGGGRDGGAPAGASAGGGAGRPAANRSGGGFSPPAADDGDDFGGGDFGGGGGGGETPEKIPF